jgi:hypothetical protein
MQLTHDIRKLTDISHLVTVVLSNEDALSLKGEYDSKVVSESHVEGFRKGKAPIQVVAAKVGREKYWKDMREYVASKALEEALKGEEISPIVPPVYEFADWQEGGKFVFTTTIYTQPPDPADMFIKPDIAPPTQAPSLYSHPIMGIPGEMPIIDGKLPPHLAGVDPAPRIPSIPQTAVSPTSCAFRIKEKASPILAS